MYLIVYAYEQICIDEMNDSKDTRNMREFLYLHQFYQDIAYIVKFSNFKYIIQWILTNVYITTTTSKIQNIYITLKSSLVPLYSLSPYPSL